MGRNFSRRDLVVTVGLVGVVAAIAIMVVLAWPAVPRDGRRPNCQLNEHSIGLGHMLYRNDNGGAWPEGNTSAECLGKLYPEYVKALATFSCPGKPTDPEFVAGEIRNTGYLWDVAVPNDAHVLRVVLGDRRGNHEGGSVLLFADGHVEFCEEVDGLLPNPYLPEDTDVYSDQPDVDSTIDCDL